MAININFELERIIRLDKKSLFRDLSKEYSGKITVKKDRYILVKGDIPLMLVAHLDTVHHDNVTMICRSDDGNIIMSPQGIGGDDRCGVYALKTVYKQQPTGKKPWLLFTQDEEIGGIGAKAFADDMPYKKQLKKIKLIIEVDRKGKNDAVYYDCDCPELEEYIDSKGYRVASGSYSDICDVAPAVGCSAVNLSSGYYNAHTRYEYINIKHLMRTIDTICEIAGEIDSLPRYEWKEIEYVSKWGNGNYWSVKYGDGWDYGYGYSSKTKNSTKSTKPTEINYDYDYDYDYDTDYYYGPPTSNSYFVDLSDNDKFYYQELLWIYTEKELDDYIYTFGTEFLADEYENEKSLITQIKKEAEQEEIQRQARKLSVVPKK